MAAGFTSGLHDQIVALTEAIGDVRAVRLRLARVHLEYLITRVNETKQISTLRRSGSKLGVQRTGMPSIANASAYS